MVLNILCNGASTHDLISIVNMIICICAEGFLFAQSPDGAFYVNTMHARAHICSWCRTIHSETEMINDSSIHICLYVFSLRADLDDLVWLRFTNVINSHESTDHYIFPHTFPNILIFAYASWLNEPYFFCNPTIWSSFFHSFRAFSSTSFSFFKKKKIHPFFLFFRILCMFAFAQAKRD